MARQPVPKLVVQIGGKQIKDALLDENSNPIDLIAMLEVLFPHLPEKTRQLMIDYPKEVSVSGATLRLPQSWS